MNIWTLLLVFSVNNGGADISMDFATRDMCELAASKVNNHSNAWTMTVPLAVCVERDKP